MSPGRITIVMGVAGCGKTTLAAALAATAHGSFLDADDFHSAANKQKMAAGVALADADREPWLGALNHALLQRTQHATPTFVACSALRRRYRIRLTEGLTAVRWVYLQIDKELARQRIDARRASGHFMPAALIDSQFAALEEPAPDEAIRLDAAAPVSELVAQLLVEAPHPTQLE